MCIYMWVHVCECVYMCVCLNVCMSSVYMIHPSSLSSRTVVVFTDHIYIHPYTHILTLDSPPLFYKCQDTHTHPYTHTYIYTHQYTRTIIVFTDHILNIMRFIHIILPFQPSTDGFTVSAEREELVLGVCVSVY